MQTARRRIVRNNAQMHSTIATRAMLRHRAAAMNAQGVWESLLNSLRITQTTLAMLLADVQMPELTAGRPASPHDALIFLCRAVLDQKNTELIRDVGTIFKRLAGEDSKVFHRLVPIRYAGKPGWATPLQLAALCDNPVMFRAILAEIHRTLKNRPAISPLSVPVNLYKDDARSAILPLSPLHIVILNTNAPLVYVVLDQCLCSTDIACAVARSEHTLTHAVKTVQQEAGRILEEDARLQERVAARIKRIRTLLTAFYDRVPHATRSSSRASVVDQLLVAAASSFYSSPTRCAENPRQDLTTHQQTGRCN